MPDDTFVPNVVQIGQETAEKQTLAGERKANQQKNIILPQILKKNNFYKNGNILIYVQFLDLTRHYAEICQLCGMVVNLVEPCLPGTH